MKGIEFMLKYFPHMVEKVFLPPRKGWTALDENGTGKVTGINLEQVSKRLNKAADNADKLQEAVDFIEEAKKKNGGLPF